jgi:hypothetical protein
VQPQRLCGKAREARGGRARPINGPGEGLGKEGHQVVKYRRSEKGKRIPRRERGKRWEDETKKLSKRSE